MYPYEAVLIFLATTVMGIAVWAFRLEGKVTTNEAVHATRFDHLDERHLDLKEFMAVQFGDQAQRLERIERALNGHLRGPYDNDRH